MCSQTTTLGHIKLRVYTQSLKLGKSETGEVWTWGKFLTQIRAPGCMTKTTSGCLTSHSRGPAPHTNTLPAWLNDWHRFLHKIFLLDSLWFFFLIINTLYHQLENGGEHKYSMPSLGEHTLHPTPALLALSQQLQPALSLFFPKEDMRYTNTFSYDGVSLC